MSGTTDGHSLVLTHKQLLVTRSALKRQLRVRIKAVAVCQARRDDHGKAIYISDVEALTAVLEQTEAALPPEHRSRP